MKNYYYTFLLLLCMATSCSTQYNVTGVSNVEDLEGEMLYLKVYHEDDMQTIDSSRVVHGKFKFVGNLDSTVMANLFFEGQSIMPVVLEDGEVKIKINQGQQNATGTPLNDTLSNFIQKKSQLDARFEELPRMESQMIMDGIDHDVVLMELSKQAKELAEEDDRLVTSFIRSNYNNVLGPGVFMILTSRLQYPVMNPQIEDIISQASPYFLNHPYVKEYIKTAESNMEKLRDY